MREKAEEELLMKGKKKMRCPGYTDAEGGSVVLRQGSTASEPRTEIACSVSSNDPFIQSGPNHSGVKIPLISEWPLQDERQLEHLLAISTIYQQAECERSRGINIELLEALVFFF